MRVSTSALAQWPHNENELRLVSGISVLLSDEVKRGCLKNPNALKVEAELVLRRSGISVADSAPYYLVIAPLGWEMMRGEQPTGECVVTMRLQLVRYEKVFQGHSAIILVYDKSYLLTGHSKSEMQERLRAQVSETVSDLANEILKARGH